MRAPLARELFGCFAQELQKRRDGTIQPVPVPWSSLEASLSGGLWPKTLTVLAGSSGVGKTTMAVAIAAHAAKQGVPVVYLSLELDREEMAARIFAVEAGVRWSDLLLGRSGHGLAHAKEAALRAARRPGWPLHVYAQEGGSRMPCEEVEACLAALRRRYRGRLADEEGKQNQPCLVIVDYLQLLDAPDAGGDTRNRIGAVATSLRGLARDNHAAVLAISSVARTHYSNLSGGQRFRPGKDHPERLMGVAKESGELEYSADNLLVLALDRSNSRAPDGTPAWVGVAKSRWGTRSLWAELRFHDGTFRACQNLVALK